MTQEPKISHVDVLVVGAGLLGSSVAMALSQRQPGSLTEVLDLDLQGTYSSSELNAGGVRGIWYQEANALLSTASLRFYESIAEQIGFHQKGYCWMYSPGSFEQAQDLLSKNSELKDWPLDFLSPKQLSSEYIFLDKVENLGGAVFSSRDGLINSNLLKLYYRTQAQKLSSKTIFRDRIFARAFERLSDGRFRIYCKIFPESIQSHQIQSYLEFIGKASLESAKIDDQQEENFLENLNIKVLDRIYETKTLVNCCGPWARSMDLSLGLIPLSTSVRRQIVFFQAKDLDLSEFGMFVDSSGVYFHTEGPYILAGYADPQDQEAYSYEFDGESFFLEKIWPALYERSHSLENLRFVSGWAGLYEISPDHSAIIGSVSDIPGLYEAHSFSGRGVMQSYGAGQGLADLILYGRYKSLDLTPFSRQRFESGALLNEALLI